MLIDDETVVRGESNNNCSYKFLILLVGWGCWSRKMFAHDC